MTPETRYARSGDVYIAYRVLGEGPPDLILVAGLAIELADRGSHVLKGVPDEWRLFAVAE